MDTSSVQQALFKQVKERIPAHLSLADDLAQLLGISADSAYRRIRGEKTMDLGELAKVCRHYHLSLDALLALERDTFVFNGRFVGDADLPIAKWLEGMNAQLDQLAGMKEVRFIFRAEDIPTFHHFQIPELTVFKLFFWRRTILNDPSFQNKRLDLQEQEEELLALARKVYLTYLRLPSTEIWNADSMNAFLRQITFYRDAGLFTRPEDVDRIFSALHQLIDHLQAQVAHGVKFLAGASADTGTAAFNVYVNEVMQGDNLIFAGSGAQRMVFVNHSAIDFVSTSDSGFCDHVQASIDNVIRKSVLISGTGAKDRSRFFNALRAEVDRRRA